MGKINYLTKYIKRYKRQIKVSLGFLSLESILSLYIFYIIGNVIDKGVKGHNIGYILNSGLKMLLVTLLMALATIIRNRYSSRASQGLGADLRSDLYKKIQSLDYEELNKYEKAELQIRLTNDVSQIQGFFHSLIRVFFKAPLLAIGAIGLSFFLSMKLSLIIIVLLPVCSYLIYKNLKKSYPSYQRVQASVEKVAGVLSEYLSGIQVVKSFNMQDYEEDKFQAANEEYREANTIALDIMSVFVPLLTFVVNMGLVFILSLGGLSVMRGGMEVGVLVSLTNYMGQILFGLVILGRFLNRGLRSKTSAERISQILQLEEEAIYRGKEASGYSIRLDDLNFKYDPRGDYNLRNINLEIREGEKLGIIGATGSGKTTLINLIIGNYRATSGSVYLGGDKIQDLSLRSIRNLVGLVDQDIFLFKASIDENISLNRQGDLDLAKEVAEVKEFVDDLDQGGSTLLEENASNLSGGQRQRLSIARGIFAGPRLIILDNATSNLDSITEGKIIRNILGQYKEETLLVVSQKIASLKGLDRTIVMKDGEIEAVGSHQELMEKSQAYRLIYDSQIGELKNNGKKG